MSDQPNSTSAGAECPTAWTPGPWTIRTRKGTLARTVHPTGSADLLDDVCNVLGSRWRAPHNARLIAAAPDLVEALKNLRASAALMIAHIRHDIPDEPPPGWLADCIRDAQAAYDALRKTGAIT